VGMISYAEFNLFWLQDVPDKVDLYDLSKDCPYRQNLIYYSFKQLHFNNSLLLSRNYSDFGSTSCLVLLGERLVFITIMNPSSHFLPWRSPARNVSLLELLRGTVSKVLSRPIMPWEACRQVFFRCNWWSTSGQLLYRVS
jgi:hypothetical protein